MAGMMDYCHCAPVAASNIEEGARHSPSLEPKILGTHYRWEDWVNQQRNLGEAARKETTRRRKTFRVSEEDAEGISSMARLQMTRGQLGQSQNAENAAGSNPSRSTAHVEEEEDGEQGARLEAAKGGRLISPAFTIFF